MDKTYNEVIFDVNHTHSLRQKCVYCKDWDVYDLIMKRYNCTDETAKAVVKAIKGRAI